MEPTENSPPMLLPRFRKVMEDGVAAMARPAGFLALMVGGWLSFLPELLAAMEPDERAAFFQDLAAGYCVRCGGAGFDGPCRCGNDD